MPPERSRPSHDPIDTALQWLSEPKRRPTLLKALEARIAGDLEERRQFAAAAGRVRDLSGPEALVEAVRQYLFSLRKGLNAGQPRTAMLAVLADTVAAHGSPAKAEAMWAALTRKRPEEPVASTP